VRIFVFALPFEAAGFRPEHENSQVWVLGVIGNSAAEKFEERLNASDGPSLVVSAGLAGALRPGLLVGDIIVGADSEPRFLEKILPREGTTWTTGQIHTVDSIASTHQEKAMLAERTGATVCDMESARIAKICQSRGIAFAGVRAVSDTLGFDMPVPPQYLAHPETGKPDVPRLLSSLLKSPSKIPAFYQMIREASLARKALQAFLNNLV